MATPDLSTTCLGLHLKNPLVVSAWPLSKKLQTVRRQEEAGAAAIAMYSLLTDITVLRSRRSKGTAICQNLPTTGETGG